MRARATVGIALACAISALSGYLFSQTQINTILVLQFYSISSEGSPVARWILDSDLHKSMKLELLKKNQLMGNINVGQASPISTFMDLDVCFEERCLTHLILGRDKHLVHIGSTFLEKSSIVMTDFMTGREAGLGSYCQAMIGGICVPR